jgi:4-amino-4-deoxy-L-arabinose transferase-like glycosyltransferase
MRTAEPLPRSAYTREDDRPAPQRSRSRIWAWAGLAAVLLGGLALRLWGVRQGLPYAYNTDEADHFVPHAVRMFAEGTLNPHYFGNPPAFTYLLHYLLAAWFGGGAGARSAFALHPDQVYTLSRVATAVLGTAALWLLYATGARLFGRGVGLLAAAIEAVAFLPVFYSHLALNDVPTLVPLTVALLGSAGVLRSGRRRDYLIAGIGLGLGCASKYTAGIVVLPLAAAVAVRYLQATREGRAGVVVGALLAAAAALLAFLIANPYALLDLQSFHRELVHQSTLSAEAQGKLGAPRHGGVVYYLWSLTWGLGWVPALAALGGAVTIWRADSRLGWLLVPAPLVFLAFMGLQGRYFGRWLMPILPVVCLLAAFSIVQLGGALAAIAARRRRAASAMTEDEPGVPPASSPGVPWVRAIVLAALIAAALVQGLVYSIHSGLVLSRADTRNLTRAWMLAHIPAGSAIVAEPVSPDEWAHQVRPGTSTAQNSYQWKKYPSLVSRISATGAVTQATRQVGIENYERTLSPALIGYYVEHGYCWVLSGSTQSGRAFADPAAVPQAIAYYRELARQGQVVYRSSPYARGQHAVPFGFDWSFDYYPLAYERPGPQITIYRLHGGRCPR